jgi:hypothetical protein
MEMGRSGAHTAVMAALSDTLTCPQCRRRTDADRCFSCGLPQTGEQVSRLRAVVDRLDTIERAQYALTAESTVLRREKADLLRALGAGAGTGPLPRPQRPAPESRPEVVRDVLLWLGSALVAVAALIFALFAWRQLDDSGRAILLFAVTFLAALGAYGMLGRLPATAEALGGLTLALFLVDWFVLRKGGVGAGLSPEAWWAVGTAMAAGLSVAAAPWLKLQAIAAAVLVQVSAVLFVTRLDEQWLVALALALVAAPLAAAAGRLFRSPEWAPAASILAGGVVLMKVAVLVMVADLFVLGDWATSARLALVLAAGALAPAAAVVTRGGEDRALRDGMATAGAAALFAAVAMLAAAVFTTPASLLAATALLGAAGVALALGLRASLRPGTLYAAAGTLGLGLIGLLEPIGAATAVPLSWLSEPWEGSLVADAAASLAQFYDGSDVGFGAAVVALLALAGAAGALILAGDRRPVPAFVGWVAAGLAATGLVAVVPLAAGVPVWVAALITAAGALVALGVAAGADRRGLVLPSLAAAAAAGALGVTATGWALATEAGTLAFLAGVALAAGAATAMARTAPFRRALAAVASVAAVAEGLAVALSAGASTAEAGMVVAMVGGAVLAAGALSRSRQAEGVALEAVGAGALVLAAGLGATEEPWLAAVLTAATAWMMVAGAAPARRGWLLAGAATSVTATWAWLAFFDVGLAEAYTVPAAVVALVAGVVARAAPGAGWMVRRRSERLDSWAAFAPGLAVGLLPSVVLVLTDGGLARPLAVTAAALAVLLAGARSRLQAPMVLGAGALLIVGLDALWPVAARVPRWAAIGTVGILLLWLGATAERRLTQLREAGRRFRDLEPDGPAGQPA